VLAAGKLDSASLNIPDGKLGVYQPLLVEPRIYGTYPSTFYNVRTSRIREVALSVAMAEASTSTLDQKDLSFSAEAMASYVKVAGSGFTKTSRCQFRDENTGNLIVSASTIVSEIPWYLYCEIPRISDGTTKKSATRYYLNIVSEEGVNGFAIPDRYDYMLTLRERPNIKEFYPRTGVVLDPAILVTVEGTDFPYGNADLAQKFTEAAKGVMCKLGSAPTGTRYSFEQQTDQLFSAIVLSPNMLQCNVTGSFIGARTFGVTFDGVTFLMFDKLFHITKHAQTLRPQRGLAPELVFRGIDLPFKGLTDGGDPK
jgi:hypothetical protein